MLNHLSVDEKGGSLFAGPGSCFFPPKLYESDHFKRNYKVYIHFCDDSGTETTQTRCKSKYVRYYSKEMHSFVGYPENPEISFLFCLGRVVHLQQNHHFSNEIIPSLLLLSQEE